MAAAGFFEQQHLARRNTRVMVLLFTLAVAGVVAAVDLVLAVVYLFGSEQGLDAVQPSGGLGGLLAAVPLRVYLLGGVVTAGVILAVSLVNIGNLAGGGRAVAQMVGAREIGRGTRDPLERRLLNVVDEMAIASGTRTPGVYVMDGEQGINAFAAGYDVSNTVVVVTRGALETLNRDELQGIIGHEFSHILNADIRLNISMIGVLAGILFLSTIGAFLMRNARGRAAAVMISVGLGLFIIGYAGLFFGRIIKAAVSRQREFLADASSVQFTRNPDGIAGALDQIRSATALVASRRAEDLSHMFFVQGIRVWFGALFDTHPPIDERIDRVRPGFQPVRYRGQRAPAAVASEPVPPAAASLSGQAPAQPAGRRTGDLAAAWARSPEESAGLVGTFDAAKVDSASRLLAGLPVSLQAQVREAESAQAVLLALLFATDEQVMQGQVQALEAAGYGGLAERARSCVPLTRTLGIALHLPVIDLALPALRSLSDKQKLDLLTALDAVIRADRRVSLHEFIVWTLVRTRLVQPAAPRPPKHRTIADVREDAIRVLGFVARAGQTAAVEPEPQTAKAFAKGAAEMRLEAPGMLGPESLSLEAVTRALENLRDLAPRAKAVLIKGLFATVTADGKIRIAEAELMRLIGAILDCPLPPLLDSLDPAAPAA